VTAAVLSLALGIGATTIVFSAFRSAILKPLPYADPERLVEITQPIPDGRTISVTVADVGFLKAHATSFALIGTYGFFRPFTLTGMGEPANVVARVAEPGLFATLGTRPLLGRVFTPGDFENANPLTTVLTWDLWNRQFNADPASIGRRAMPDNASYTIIGVMPYDFRFTGSFTTL
jgi:putative ABC transport system permease protein